MAYLQYDDTLEQTQPDEAAQIEQIVDSMDKLNRAIFEKHRHAVRDAHAKSHGILKGELVVDPGLPPHLAQGLFARPGRHDVIIRLSSAPGDIHSDKLPSLRGMAIKVLNVEGLRLLPGDPGRNQDFLMVTAPTIPFGTVKAYLDAQKTIELLETVPDSVQEAGLALVRGAKGLLGMVGVETPAAVDALAAPNDHILGLTFHSMAAIRYGEHVAKVSVGPKSPEVQALTGVSLGYDASFSAQRDAVVAHFARQGAEYQFYVQLCTDPAKMPIEDASVLWPEALSPHQPVARIVIPPQDAYSDARRVYGDDVLSFNPWQGVEAHRPLGSIMRSRRAAYEASSARRHALNVQPRTEPASVADLPD